MRVQTAKRQEWRRRRPCTGGSNQCALTSSTLAVAHLVEALEELALHRAGEGYERAIKRYLATREDYLPWLFCLSMAAHDTPGG